MIKILFICHGNICRSPMAEYVMKDMIQKAGLQGEVEVASAATSTEEVGNGMYPKTRAILERYQIPYGKHTARVMRKEDYDKYDYILVMDRMNLRNLERIVGEDAEHKIARLLDLTSQGGDIADPWYTGDFETTYSDVVRGCRALLGKIQEDRNTN